MTAGWFTSSFYRPPLVVASIAYAVRAQSLINNEIEIWPHHGQGWFWPTMAALVSLIAVGTAINPTPRSRWIAACAIVAYEMFRATAVFAEFGAEVSHIIAQHVLIAFFAAYLLIDENDCG